MFAMPTAAQGPQMTETDPVSVCCSCSIQITMLVKQITKYEKKTTEQQQKGTLFDS
jgi:hypothetical protein